jgi:hypothetical protein
LLSAGISQAAKSRGDPKVVAWLRAEQQHCYTSAIVVAQLAYWVRTKNGRQREALQDWLTRFVDALRERIHGFNDGLAGLGLKQVAPRLDAVAATSRNSVRAESPRARGPLA